MTSPVSSGSAAVQAVDVAPLTSLSSAEILDFGASMTARFDEQILAAMNDMRGALGETDEISATRQALQTFAAELLQANDDPNHAHELTEAQFERLRELGVLDELGLDSTYVTADDSNPFTHDEAPSITPNALDRVDAQLELRQSQVNSEQQQRLLVLQETMRQRSQLAQLLSNVLRERGEAMNHIVRNIA